MASKIGDRVSVQGISSPVRKTGWIITHKLAGSVDWKALVGFDDGTAEWVYEDEVTVLRHMEEIILF